MTAIKRAVIFFVIFMYYSSPIWKEEDIIKRQDNTE